jgi:exodeoxyribonuclease V alpha subunit
LCAHRTGAASVEQLNPRISRALGVQRGVSYAGRPIIITQNDYASALFNGDVGVLHQDGDAKRELSACFRESADSVRQISLARLPAHESAYAMTVHKSQGSEFDHVAIVLPERPSRILSRELLYTAITRAKRSVSLYASESALRAAVLQRVERSSGLVARLTQS